MTFELPGLCAKVECAIPLFTGSEGPDEAGVAGIIARMTSEQPHRAPDRPKHLESSMHASLQAIIDRSIRNVESNWRLYIDLLCVTFIGIDLKPAITLFAPLLLSGRPRLATLASPGPLWTRVGALARWLVADPLAHSAQHLAAIGHRQA